MAIQKTLAGTGFYPKKSWGPFNRSPKHFITIQNIAGYIPLIGIAIGGARIYSVSKGSDAESPLCFKATMITRGVIEVLGGGLLFLIPDLIVTFSRSKSEKTNSAGNSTDILSRTTPLIV